jgi:rhamnosyltransferase subunit B
MFALLVAVGSHGDVLPFIGMGAELVRRGHQVKIAAPAPFRAAAARAGLGFHPLGSMADFDTFTNDADLWHARRGVASVLAVANALTEPAYRWLKSEWRTDDSIVIASTLSLGALVACDRLGHRVVTVHLVPMLVESRYNSPILPGVPVARYLSSGLRHRIARGADRHVIGPAALPSLNAFRASLDLPPVIRLRHWWNAKDRVILMFPDWYARPQRDWPKQALQVGFPLVDRFGDTDTLASDLTDFIEAGDPPLVFTYGSAMRQGARFFAEALKLCRSLSRRGVFLAGQAGQVPSDLPPSVFHARYAPLSLLLPRCAALIHHGGIGTVVQALAAGLPQVIAPVAFNHFDDGARVERLGVGTTLRGPFTAARGGRALGRLLSSRQVARNCAFVRQQMQQQNGVSVACDEIEKLTADASHCHEPSDDRAAVN